MEGRCPRTSQKCGELDSPDYFILCGEFCEAKQNVILLRHEVLVVEQYGRIRIDIILRLFLTCSLEAMLCVMVLPDMTGRLFDSSSGSGACHNMKTHMFTVERAQILLTQDFPKLMPGIFRANGCSTGIATGWTSRVRFAAEAEDFSLLHSVQTGSGTQPPSQWVRGGDVHRGSKRPGRETGYSPQSSA
jgi:hypothetical protein